MCIPSDKEVIHVHVHVYMYLQCACACVYQDEYMCTIYMYVCVPADNEATLFRASTLATMLMDQLMKLTASNYLHNILEGPIQQIADLQDSCEVHVQHPLHTWTSLPVLVYQ